MMQINKNQNLTGEAELYWTLTRIIRTAATSATAYPNFIVLIFSPPSHI